MEEFGELCQIPKVSLSEMEAELNKAYPDLPFVRFLVVLLKKVGISGANEEHWEEQLWGFMMASSEGLPLPAAIYFQPRWKISTENSLHFQIPSILTKENRHDPFDP